MTSFAFTKSDQRANLEGGYRALALVTGDEGPVIVTTLSDGLGTLTLDDEGRFVDLDTSGGPGSSIRPYSLDVASVGDDTFILGQAGSSGHSYTVDADGELTQAATTEVDGGGNPSQALTLPIGPIFLDVAGDNAYGLRYEYLQFVQISDGGLLSITDTSPVYLDNAIIRDIAATSTDAASLVVATFDDDFGDGLGYGYYEPVISIIEVDADGDATTLNSYRDRQLDDIGLGGYITARDENGNSQNAFRNNLVATEIGDKNYLYIFDEDIGLNSFEITAEGVLVPLETHTGRTCSAVSKPWCVKSMGSPFC